MRPLPQRSFTTRKGRLALQLSTLLRATPALFPDQARQGLWRLQDSGQILVVSFLRIGVSCSHDVFVIRGMRWKCEGFIGLNLRIKQPPQETFLAAKTSGPPGTDLTEGQMNWFTPQSTQLPAPLPSKSSSTPDRKLKSQYCL
jgi:hypothetical protein